MNAHNKLTALLESGYSLDTIAHDCGVSRRTVEGWLHGRGISKSAGVILASLTPIVTDKAKAREDVRELRAACHDGIAACLRAKADALFPGDYKLAGDLLAKGNRAADDADYGKAIQTLRMAADAFKGLATRQDDEIANVILQADAAANRGVGEQFYGKGVPETLMPEKP